ncbi:MAG: hypothetical protein N838_28975 [Thiohalocapsa sp. PB-PSB1]|nr:MAG: hypothetical protein N838_28975 [Thiohalocapsa sp. PB-PSB1]
MTRGNATEALNALQLNLKVCTILGVFGNARWYEYSSDGLFRANAESCYDA